jgi:hypothetical protein
VHPALQRSEIRLPAGTGRDDPPVQDQLTAVDAATVI